MADVSKRFASGVARSFSFESRSRRTFGGMYGLIGVQALGLALDNLPPFDAIDYETIGNGSEASLFVAIPMIGWTVRRLHDINLSGWWAAPLLPILLMPKGTLTQLPETLLVIGAVPALWAIMLWPPSTGANRFGPDPRLDDKLKQQKEVVA